MRFELASTALVIAVIPLLLTNAQQTPPSSAAAPASPGDTLRLPLTVRSVIEPFVELRLVHIERTSPDSVRLEFEFRNLSPDFARLAVDYRRTQVANGSGGEFAVIADADGTAAEGVYSIDLAPQAMLRHWIAVSVPAAARGPFGLVLAPALDHERAARFPALRFAIP